MRHQNKRGAFLAIERQQEVQNLLAVGAVEIAGGLVGHQDGRLHHKSASQGHTLLFAARELYRVVIQAFLQADADQKFARAGNAAGFLAGEFGGQQHIFFRRQGWDELVGLKDESQLHAAHLGHLVFGEVGDVDAVEDDAASSGRVQPRQKTQKRTLSAAGSAHDGNKLAGGYVEVNTAQNIHAMGAGVDGPGQSCHLNDGCLHGEQAELFIMALVKFSNVFLLFAMVFLCACGSTSGDPAAPPPVAATKLPVSTEPAKPAQDDSRPVIVAFGDSLSAGYGLEAGQSFPDQLQNLLNAKGLQYRVVNQGISGDTTSGGLARVEQAVALQPKIVLLELGGNDGLRGVPVYNIRKNLDAMIRRFKEAGATVVLVGITLPRNYGDDYIRGFEKNYVDLAKEHSLTYVPFLLDGIWTPTGGVPGMFQDDGIHPTAKGTPVMAATVFKKIEKLL